MKKTFLFLFFILHSSFFILKAQPLGQYPPQNVMWIDALPLDTYAKLRIGASAGGAYRIASMSGNQQEANSALLNQQNQQLADFFNNGMKLGISFNVDLTYFFSENFGAGAVYSYVHNSNKIDDFMYLYNTAFPESSELTGTIEERITIQFIGPAFQYRYYTNYREDAFRAHVGLGYVDYRDNFSSPRRLNSAEWIGGKESITSGTFGIHLGIGYDFALNETWALGVGLSALIASRSSENRTTASGQVESFANTADNLTRVELTVGLRFNK